MPIFLPVKDFTYERFIKHLEAEDSKYIREQINEFSRSFCESSLAETPLRQSQGLPKVVLPTSFNDSISSTDAEEVKESLFERQQRRGKEYLKLLESFGLVMLRDPFWALYNTDGTQELDHDSDEMAAYFEIIFSHLESYIVPHIHRHLWVPDKKADWDISLKCLEYEFIRPTHLDLPFLPEDMTDLVEKCSSIFTEMAFEQIPSVKLKFLNTVWKFIQVFLAVSREPTPTNPAKTVHPSDASLNKVSMDDMMPVLVYILVKSHPPQLLSDLNFLIATCRDITQFGTAASFFVTNTQAAIEFVRNLSMDKLSAATDKDFVPKPHLRLASSLPTKREEAASSSSGKPASGFLNVKNRISTVVGKVADSVADTVSTVATKVSPLTKSRAAKLSMLADWALIEPEASSSTPSPTPQKKGPIVVESLNRRDSVGTVSHGSSPVASSTVDLKDDVKDTKGNGIESTVPKPPQLPSLSDLQRRYPFYDKSSADLTPIDVTILLQEYKMLAEFHWQNSST